jgi:hypothetical protein
MLQNEIDTFKCTSDTYLRFYFDLPAPLKTKEMVYHSRNASPRYIRPGKHGFLLR